MATEDQERPWLPVYDEIALEETIKQVAAKVTGHLAKDFYVPSFTDPQPCQGDVLEMSAGIPVIDEDGDVAADEQGPVEHWLVVANTCDVQRTFDTEDVEYVSIAPMYRGESLDAFTVEEFVRKLKLYQLTRMFFVPSWDGQTGDHVADLTRIVPVHRASLHRAQIKARMQMDTWALLNACLVRFLCREDKRFD